MKNTNTVVSKKRKQRGQLSNSGYGRLTIKKGSNACLENPYECFNIRHRKGKNKPKKY